MVALFLRTGFTEHSVIAKCNTLELEVAFGNLEGLWDAPYSTWRRFQFDECFIASDAGSKLQAIRYKL